MKVLVVSGGTSSEREVSILSGKAVYEAGKTSGHEMTLYDWDGGLEWIVSNAPKFDAILPIMHGTGAEDGRVQEVLQRTGVPFLGSDSKVSKTCFDKLNTLKIFRDNGIKVAKSELVNFDKYLKSPISKGSHVLKPNENGSSIGVIIVKDPSDKDEATIKSRFKEYEEMLLEEFIEGSEITVPVLEGRRLPVIEIIPPEGQTFDYENKYNGSTLELCPPKNVTDKLQGEAVSLGEQIHRLVGCRHLSRVDMIIKKGELYVLEINTMPGMTAQSLYPKAAAAVGLDFPALVDYFIKLVLK